MTRITCLLALALALTTGCGGDNTADTGGSGGATDAGMDVESDTAANDAAANDAAPDQAAEDANLPDAETPDVINDTSTPDADAASVEYTSMGTLAVDCDVPFVLDASKVTNMPYMTSHFGDLVQDYGITGVIGGQDITTFPEKMFYGMHTPPTADPSDLLSLTQLSMQTVSDPRFSVRVDFQPDTDVTPGSTWPVGIDNGQAAAVLFRHVSATQLCMMSIGVGGSLTFQTATNVTTVEGGAFHVVGSINMVVPEEVPDICDIAQAGGFPCCQ